MILVTRPYLPPRERLDRYVDRIYASGQLTNNGELVQELTARLEAYLGVENLLLVANGTLALQVAYTTLGVTGSAVTTPFTFPATSSALVWEGIEPIYAALRSETLNLDPVAAEYALQESTTAIVPVHTYGNPCDVESFEALGLRRGVKIIYDASHTFGVRYKNNSLLRWGDAATLSFHATKLFHTVEGGGVAFRSRSDYERACRMINFGLENGRPVDIGINAKLSEFHAAMGLAVLDDIDTVISSRVDVQGIYRRHLPEDVRFPDWSADATPNGAYVPVLFNSREVRDEVQRRLSENGVASRAYFSPSLDTLSIYSSDKTGYGKPFADNVLCLPVYVGLSEHEVIEICQLVAATLKAVTGRDKR